MAAPSASSRPQDHASVGYLCDRLVAIPRLFGRPRAGLGSTSRVGDCRRLHTTPAIVRCCTLVRSKPFEASVHPSVQLDRECRSDAAKASAGSQQSLSICKPLHVGFAKPPPPFFTRQSVAQGLLQSATRICRWNDIIPYDKFSIMDVDKFGLRSLPTRLQVACSKHVGGLWFIAHALGVRI